MKKIRPFFIFICYFILGAVQCLQAGGLQEVYRDRPAPPPIKYIPYIGVYTLENQEMPVLENKGRLFIYSGNKMHLLKDSDSHSFQFSDTPGKTLVFKANETGDIVQASIGDRVFKKKLFKGTFKIDHTAPVEEIRKRCINAAPPLEYGDFNTPDLVEVIKIEPSIKTDIRYATDNNFMGEAFYSQPRAFLQRPAAEALVRVHRKVSKYGFGILIYDAYRPWYVTKMFWEATPESMKNFVANPAGGSRHNRGTAVDITFFDLKTGEPVDMTSGYDEFSSRAYPDFPGGSSLERWHRQMLISAMNEEGFTVNSCEWWHFDHKDWKRYRIMNTKFEDL